jgi:hypothetical protein
VAQNLVVSDDPDDPIRIRATAISKEVQQIKVGASYYLLAFLPALLGLAAGVGFDGFLDTAKTAELDTLAEGLRAAFSGDLWDEVLEAIVNSAFLGASLLLMFGFKNTLPVIRPNR